MQNFINQKILPPIMKFVNTRAIKALKDGMVLSLPFIMVGSVFLLLASFPIPAVANWMNQTGLTPYWNQAYNASFGIVAVFAVVGIAYTWAKNEHVEGLPAGMTAFVGFLIIMNSTTPVKDGAKTVISAAKAPNLLIGFIDRTWLGGQGMIAAIIVGLITGWIYTWFVKKKITIKLPDQVPPAVANSFVALIPSAVLTVWWLLVYIFFDKVAHTTLTQWIYTTIQTPLQGVTDSFGGILLLTLLVPFFWFFGVHGSTLVGGIAGPILSANALENAAIFKKLGYVDAAHGGHIVIQGLFDQFSTVTGAGMTIGLVVFMTFMAKSTQLKSIGKLALVPGIFNINEPVLFGLPIVMNPMLAIPFFIMPPLSAGSTYLLIKAGILPYLNGVQVPWTTPPVVSGFLIGGWKVAIWQAMILVVSFFVYLPFVRSYDKMLYEKEQAKVTEEKA
ncbi:PTS sugar transporter subunit IIC [Lactobacillus helveticus]|uniref:Permease IIC component n=1 Tax=Lactobacillus helveticus TaxID=1587 RepID=A0A3Q8SRZ2_LACHE|nr:PTS sugar transporter subunit IIC [Lactobacillus helveticus]AFR21571.1 PTS system cellobiose-specific transporter subunit IIC [Lactobacillus helveticus R0052]AZK92293.1 Lichenan permease IIC component [Lactobacillus helveticus]MCJ2189552.1 PTS sugar transporter subunit IIC [Lactobacillus helveticus]MED7627559.1 PTS sugar transporter subunit IIC [Lactobacillus helveticus]MZR05016.1 PTS transporter subunit EIIC [Lactobacillus helveticus]